MHVLKCEKVLLIGTWLVDGVLVDVCSSFRVHHWGLVCVYLNRVPEVSAFFLLL